MYLKQEKGSDVTDPDGGGRLIRKKGRRKKEGTTERMEKDLKLDALFWTMRTSDSMK